eukprot:GHVN01031032.1.p1 GENE.GHVN01031032.1~~GHVN01031032.1.p1  ORF type:complete len:263 (-),score=34.03 GHVN01031032.1:390-1178(-)
MAFTVIGIYSNAKEQAGVRDDVRKVGEWLDGMGLMLSEKKCKVVKFGRKESNEVYLINGMQLETVDHYRDLGVEVDKSLSWRRHCDAKVVEGHRAVSYWKRKFGDKKGWLTLRVSEVYVRPRLDYCSPVWSPYQKGLKRKLESVQSRVVKGIGELRGKNYAERLQHLGMVTLEERQILADMKLLWPMRTGKSGLLENEIFVKAEQTGYGTGQAIKHGYMQKPYRVEIRGATFSQRMARRVNPLPEKVTIQQTIRGMIKHLKV